MRRKAAKPKSKSDSGSRGAAIADKTVLGDREPRTRSVAPAAMRGGKRGSRAKK